MSTVTENPTPAPEDPVKERGAWSLSWHGVSTVARLELRQRLRSTKWYIGLAVFFVIVGVVTLLTLLTMNASSVGDVPPELEGGAGRVVFDVVVFFVLLLGVLVAPTLSSSAINGDRKEGTLAILQVTLLTPAEIAIGKVLAAWAAALAFLVVSLPFLLVGIVEGRLSIAAVLVTIGLLAFVLAVVVTLGLGFSSLVPKTSSSAVLTYLGVASLTVITLIIFGLSLALTITPTKVQVWGVPSEVESSWDWSKDENPSFQCEWYESEWDQPHTERTWWLLAINPFVIVADAMPADQPAEEEFYIPEGVMSVIRYAVREARMGPELYSDQCYYGNQPMPAPPRDRDDSPVWPWGIGGLTLLGAGALVLAVRRLSIPVGKLPRGTRIA